VQQLLQDSLVARSLKPIDELSAGLLAFQRELLADELAVKRIEVAVITFGPVKLLSDFQSPDLFRRHDSAPTVDTPLGAAIEKAVELIGARKAAYNSTAFRITARGFFC
jgi:uncharacterized protein YegL